MKRPPPTEELVKAKLSQISVEKEIRVIFGFIINMHVV